MAENIALVVSLMLTALTGWDSLWQDLADRTRTADDDRPEAALEWVAVTDDQDTRIIIPSPPRRSGSGWWFDSVSLEGQRGPQYWRWDLGDAWAEPDSQGSDHHRVVLPAPQTFQSEGPDGRAAFTVWAQNLEAIVDTDSAGAATRTRLEGDNLTLIGTAFAATIASFDMLVTREPGGDRKIVLAVRDVHMPERLRFEGGLGERIQHATLTMRVRGLGPEPPETAAAWRQRNGRVTVTGLELAWGRFHLGLDGRLELDRLDRPQGQFTVALSGLDSGLDAARAMGWISESTANAIRRGLQQLAALRNQDDPDFTLTFTMGGGTLNWAGLPLLALPAFGQDAAACSDQAAC